MRPFFNQRGGAGRGAYCNPIGARAYGAHARRDRGLSERCRALPQTRRRSGEEERTDGAAAEQRERHTARGGGERVTSREKRSSQEESGAAARCVPLPTPTLFTHARLFREILCLIFFFFCARSGLLSAQ